MQQSKPFPITAFPQLMQDFIGEASASVGCHPSFVALPLLAGLAASIGNKRVIELDSDWSEPAIIWGAIIAPSGGRKTPAQEKVTQLLQRDRGEKDLFYVSDDATVAGLRRCLEERRDPRMLLLVDELVDVFSSVGRGGQSRLSKGQWLKCWSANSLRVHRGNRAPVMIPVASVSIVGGIQPTVFRDSILKESHLQDGMCARFLLTYQTQSPQPSDQKIQVSTKKHMKYLVRCLLDLPTCDVKGFVKPFDVPLTSYAEHEWKKFSRRMDSQADRQGDELKAAYKKLIAYTARFALIFQLVYSAPRKERTTPVKISGMSLDKAIRLHDWFKFEARRVYALLSETKEDGQRRQLVDLMNRNDGELTSWKLYHIDPTHYKNDQQATAALHALVKHGRAKSVPVLSGPDGGRPTTRYVLTAKALK